jgi:DNA-binding transcriptional LysR family regulator
VVVFVRVVETGSFTTAGHALNLPRSSVSRKVSRLEDRLGVRLLHRTTRSLAMTAAGRAYFERASRAITELEDVDALVAGLGEVPKGPLRITVPVSFMETGRGIFVDFLERFPDVRLEVDVTDSYVDLVEAGFDVAVRGGKPPDPSLAGHRILSSDFELLASPSYLERRGRPSCPTDLKDHECLILGLKSPTVWPFETVRGMVEVTVRGRLACGNVMVLLEAARRGFGIARLPTGGGGFDTSGLESLLDQLCTPGGGLWLVYPSSRQLAPAVRAFIEFVDSYPLGQTVP